MPNWCYNTLEIQGNKKDIARFIKLVKGKPSRSQETQPLCFHKILPVPVELVRRTYGAEKEKECAKKQGKRLKLIKGFESEYDYRIAKWGTKWEPCMYESDYGDTWAIYVFDTAWSPPEGIVAKLAEMFDKLKITLTFNEPGMGFCGRAVYRSGKIITSKHIRY